MVWVDPKNCFEFNLVINIMYQQMECLKLMVIEESPKNSYDIRECHCDVPAMCGISAASAAAIQGHRTNLSSKCI